MEKITVAASSMWWIASVIHPPHGCTFPRVPRQWSCTTENAL